MDAGNVVGVFGMILFVGGLIVTFILMLSPDTSEFMGGVCASFFIMALLGFVLMLVGSGINFGSRGQFLPIVEQEATSAEENQ